MKVADFVGSMFKKLGETTTSASIAYLPGSFTSIRSTILSLIKEKPKWNIEILEELDNYNVSFEDKLNVIVPKIHYQDFNDKVIKIDGVKEVDLRDILTESINEVIATDFYKLITSLSHSFRSIPIIERSINLMNSWLVAYPNSRFLAIPEKTLINLSKYDRDVSLLIKEINKRFSEDRGYIETLISSIEDNRPLNHIEIFSDFNILAGCKIESEYSGIVLIFDLKINLGLMPEQVITIDDEEIASEMRFYHDVRVIKNVLYPIGGEFKPYIFESIKDVIADIVK